MRQFIDVILFNPHEPLNVNIIILMSLQELREMIEVTRGHTSMSVRAEIQT